MSVDPTQDQVQSEAPVQDPAASTPAPAANTDAAPNSQNAMMLNIAGALLRGQRVTGEHIPADSLAPLNGIIGAFIDESQIGGYIEQNHVAVRETIMAKLTDTSVEPANNILVNIISNMPQQQFSALLADNPDLNQVVSGIIQEQLSPDKLTVSDVLAQMEIAPEGLESVADLKLSELTPAALEAVPDQTLIDLAFKMPDTSVPASEGVEGKVGGFGIVAEKLNAQLAERDMEQVTFTADATVEQRTEIFNAALEQIVQYEVDNAWFYEKAFVTSAYPDAAFPGRDHSQAHLSIRDGGDINAEAQAPDYHAAFRAKAMDDMARDIRIQAPEAIVGFTQNIRINPAQIQAYVKENPDVVVAALQKPENQEKLRNALHKDFLVDNAALLKPYAGEFMQGEISNKLAGFMNELADNPMFKDLLEGFQSMMGQLAGKFGLGNMFAGFGLGGGAQPSQSSFRNQYGEAIDPNTRPTADNTNGAPIQTANIDAPPEQTRPAIPAYN